jgi:hypothetical protein
MTLLRCGEPRPPTPPSATDRYRPSNRFSAANIAWALCMLLGIGAVIGAICATAAAVLGLDYHLPLGLTILALLVASAGALGAAALERRER